jgi:hypothetical protein
MTELAVLNLPEIHAIAAMSISDDRPDIFSKVRIYLEPHLRGSEVDHYSLQLYPTWPKLREQKSLFLNDCLSLALTVALLASWESMATKILEFSSSRELDLICTKECVTILVKKQQYSMMERLIKARVSAEQGEIDPL